MRNIMLPLFGSGILVSTSPSGGGSLPGSDPYRSPHAADLHRGRRSRGRARTDRGARGGEFPHDAFRVRRGRPLRHGAGGTGPRAARRDAAGNERLRALPPAARFECAVAAVAAARQALSDLATANAARPPDEAIHIRIGVHLGDVLDFGSELKGDAVNIAARLQQMAAPDALLISDQVYQAVFHKIHCDFVDLGECTLRNITDTLRVWQVGADAFPTPPPTRA